MQTYIAGRQCGFTLIELITVITVMVILAGIAVPGFGKLLASNRQVTAINQFTTSLNHARYHAITHLERVVLCPSTDQQTCTGGFDWSNGYLSFVDRDFDRSRSAEERILQVTQPMPAGIKIQSSVGRQKITFLASGRSPGSNATFRICAESETQAGKALVLNNAGRVRLAKTLSDGSQVTCYKG